MLRIALSFCAIFMLLHPAFAGEKTYEDIAEDTYNACLELSAKQRLQANPEESLNARLEQALGDCASREPPYRKLIDGVSIKDRYDLCLEDAMLNRASAIPPKSKRETLQQTFEDCSTQELLYLGLDIKTANHSILEKEVGVHREKMLNKLIDEATWYETQVGNTMAFLEMIKDYCKPLNRTKLKAYFDATDKKFNRPANVPEDDGDFSELTSVPLEGYKIEVSLKGRQTWCNESKNVLKEKGINDVFRE